MKKLLLFALLGLLSCEKPFCPKPKPPKDCSHVEGGGFARELCDEH